MPFHTHISTPTGASIALWHLTETEAALAALLGDEAYRQLSSQGLSPKRFCEQAATRLLLDRLDETRGGVMAHTTEGQPYLTDRPGHLSISHTPAMGGYRLAPHTARGNRHRAAGRPGRTRSRSSIQRK